MLLFLLVIFWRLNNGKTLYQKSCAVIDHNGYIFCRVGHFGGHTCNFYYNQYKPRVDINSNYTMYINEYAIKNQMFYF